MLLSSPITSFYQDHVIFLLIHLTGVLCSHSSSFILSSFASLSDLSAVWNPSYPLCHSFNSSGGSVLLTSSSIIPSSQVHVLVLPCSNGVLPEFFLSHLVLTRVVPIPSCPLYSSFIALQPPMFTWCSLFLFSTAVLSIVFNSVVFFLSSFQPLKVHWCHPFVKEATLFYLFLFHFSRCHP